jgi:hypothetical protein
MEHQDSLNNYTILFFFAVTIFNDKSGIRTHEACARDLKSLPFDRSGILPTLCLGIEHENHSK